MTAMGIFMGPMQHAAFGIPLILPCEGNPITFFQMRYTRGKVNIMSYQQTLTGRKQKNKLLMPYSLPVIRKYSAYHSLPADLNIAFPRSVNRGNFALPRGSNPTA